jgi:transcriptional regulator with XRE-family HTH domain
MGTRTLGIRRLMTANQVVAYNVAKARALRGWTQEKAAEELAPYLGAKLSVASFSALERSAWNPSRIKVFSADELLALSRGFDLPIGFFFIPPPPAQDIGLQVPDGGVKGLDPIVMLDALLGATHNLAYLESELLDYSASIAPMPKSKKEKPSVSPADLTERLTPLMAMRAKTGLRSSFGDIGAARQVLERLAELLADLDEAAPGVMADEVAQPDPNTKAATGTGGATRQQAKTGGA